MGLFWGILIGVGCIFVYILYSRYKVRRNLMNDFSVRMVNRLLEIEEQNEREILKNYSFFLGSLNLRMSKLDDKRIITIFEANKNLVITTLKQYNQRDESSESQWNQIQNLSLELVALSDLYDDENIRNKILIDRLEEIIEVGIENISPFKFPDQQR